jgi:uncharacterized protein YbbK (DUF523 family)
MTGDTLKIPVGISSCLIGEHVRYDGGHKYDSLIDSQLASLFEFRPCCPEVAIGLGVPRNPIQLVRTDHGIRVRAVHDPDIDVTRKLEEYGTATARQLADLCGYIFKAGSPSCGMEGVMIWTEQGNQAGSDGTGAFAAAFLKTHPDFPVTDETRLRDPAQREQFIHDVFTRYRSRNDA